MSLIATCCVSCSAFATVLPSNSYPMRRVSNDEATSMLAPTASRAPTANANSTYNLPRFTGMAGIGTTGMQMTGGGVPVGSAGDGTVPGRKRPRLE